MFIDIQIHVTMKVVLLFYFCFRFDLGGFEIIREGDLKPMDAEQLRENAHKMVDFIADYYKNIENFPVLSQVQVSTIFPLLLYLNFC